MHFTIDAVVAPKIGFASHQNAVPLLRELSIASAAGTVVENIELRLSADPPFVPPRTWRIDRLSPGDLLQIADRVVDLNATILRALSESLSGTLTLTLHGSDGAELARHAQPVELLAHNEWGGLGAMAELLPAFVMPNDPAIDRVLKAASEVLRRAGKPHALDGYAAGSRERVWEITSALWAAITGSRLTYALPPASFERVGQKVRTPGAVLDGGVATCLDTAVLFAAALEQAGLNPLLVLTHGHAFTGVWLQPVEFATLLTDEAAAIRRRFDIDDLLLFETTLATHNPPASFSQAMAAARRQIADGAEAAFEMAIDVRRARMQKIRPLGVTTIRPDDAGAATPVIDALEAAPALPAFDVEVGTAAATAGDRIQIWQRKLLNLTTGNRLLHLPDSAKVLKLLCPDPGALEDLLAAGRKVRIAPLPDLSVGGRDEALYEQQTQESLREEVARAAMARGEALAPLPKDRLDGLVIELFRKARSDMDEGGANTLYLALGFLKWKKSANEEKVYRAPLILLPVRLERKSALSGVVMVAHEDEARFNLTLLELLRQDFDLTIPGLDGTLPSDASGIDVAGIWRTVRAAVRDMAGFEVVPDVVLGTFSFAKYLMWKDLVDRADRMKDSPLVRHLIERDGGAFADRGGFPRADELDTTVDPAELFTPLPADSSQLTAVVASAQGRDFVLDGPPGTGKSQTIANIIAHNLALGRRVLFVAEKKAALDVVQRRLADRGLGAFCLELHSAKATKSAVLKQLDRAWTTRDALTAVEWEGEAGEARRLRDDLNDLVRLLHRIEPNGWTIHRAIGRSVRDADDATPALAFAPGARHDAGDMVQLRDVARRLGIARLEVGDLPAALDGVARTDWSNGWQQDMTAAAAALPPALDALERAKDGVAMATRLPLPGGTRDALARLLAFVRVLGECHGHDLRFVFAPGMADRVDAARAGVALIASYRDHEAALSAPYAPEAARRIDVTALQAAWAAAGARFWFFATLAQRRVAKSLAVAGGAPAPVAPGADLPHLGAMRDLLDRIDAIDADMPDWTGLSTEAAALAANIARADRLRAAIAAEAGSPDALIDLRAAVARLVVDANEMLAPDGPIMAAASRLEQALATFDAAAARFATLAEAGTPADFVTLRDRATAVLTHARRLNAWTNWRRVRDEALSSDLAALVTALEHDTIAPAAISEAFETAYARWFATTRIDEEPLLNRFVAGEQADRIARFRAIDTRMGELASRYIRARLCGLIPDKTDAQRRDGYGVLKYQLQLQRPSKPIRQLAADMGDAFTRLAPCMLMSPLSIAQYLPADQALFDLVIFDEASQITPWDAVGAMARGRQVIIAGDPRQMPPSNDFARGPGSVSTDDDLEPDLDSILDECLGAGVPQHSLDWHYRSRHESLITFSNHRYYDDKLVTFPAPETRPSAVTWARVDGVWARGAERTNAIEARAIVDEAVARLRDPAFVDARGQPLTLGIITMNAEQMRLIEDLLDKARRAHPEIEPHFDVETRLEPVVVRNLETAQGDERDVILLGVGFGPTEPGGRTMSMHFGKLNAQGGWRRLNVAVTRARLEMRVFTSFDPGMIDLTRTSQPAIADLKHFIEFADRGPRALAEAVKGSLGGADSPFEEAVAMALRRRGWTVVPQVGVSKFRIDLGVVHPDRPGDYLLGVECDGATYHSAATARDRDRVRAAILESLGWNLLRIWSTDWWIDRERAADRLHRGIEARLSADRAAADARTAAEAARAAQVARASPFDEIAEEPDDAVNPAADDAIAVAPPATDTYSLTDFAPLKATIAPAAFYEPGYDPTLAALIAHVVAAEAPIAETLLVQRIARAHDFQRAGRIIRDRVMALTAAHHHIAPGGGDERFVWPDATAPAGWSHARSPATDGDLRQIEDIALEEIAAADPSDIARHFGIRRVSAAARTRIALALEARRAIL